MSGTSLDRLVYMANQIGGFFQSQAEATRAARVADHLQAFWAPSMRQAIRAHLDAGGEGLSPLVREAVALLDAPKGSNQVALAKAGERLARAPGDDAG